MSLSKKNGRKKSGKEIKQTHILSFLWALFHFTQISQDTYGHGDLLIYASTSGPRNSPEPSKVTNFFPRDDSHPQGPPLPGPLRKNWPPPRYPGPGFLRGATRTVCPTTSRPSPRVAFACDGRNRVSSTGGLAGRVAPRNFRDWVP